MFSTRFAYVVAYPVREQRKLPDIIGMRGADAAMKDSKIPIGNYLPINKISKLHIQYF